MRFSIGLQVALLLLALQNACRAPWTKATALSNQGDSFCGLTRVLESAAATNSSRRLDEQERVQAIPRLYRKKPRPSRDYVREFTEGNSIVNERNSIRTTRVQWLKGNYVPVRLRILYDLAFEAEFESYDELHMYVRNLVLNLQLIYEQPELYTYVKLYFVVTKLERLRREWAVSTTASEIIESADEMQGPTSTEDYDTTVILFYSNLFRLELDSGLLGQASVGTFCNSANYANVMLVNAHTLNNALVMAHEFAHTLNVYHDGQKSPSTFEQFCDPVKFIMGAAAGIGHNNWSNCSVEAILHFLTDDHIFKCLVSKKRVENVKFVSPLFDFRPPNSTGRSPLPGEQVPLDRQCQLGIDKSSSALTPPKVDYTVCEMLWCRVDQDLIRLGPALMGSKCSESGVCRNGRCSQ